MAGQTYPLHIHSCKLYTSTQWSVVWGGQQLNFLPINLWKSWPVSLLNTYLGTFIQNIIRAKLLKISNYKIVPFLLKLLIVIFKKSAKIPPKSEYIQMSNFFSFCIDRHFLFYIFSLKSIFFESLNCWPFLAILYHCAAGKIHDKNNVLLVHAPAKILIL